MISCLKSTNNRNLQFLSFKRDMLYWGFCETCDCEAAKTLGYHLGYTDTLMLEKKRCTSKVLTKGDVTKCWKLYCSLMDEEWRPFILRFFTSSVYHHQGNVAAYTISFKIFTWNNRTCKSSVAQLCFTVIARHFF